MAGSGTGINFKDADEVKDYLENLGVEYRFGCYHEKNPESCDLLGDYFEGIKNDSEKALKLYETTCNEYKYGHSCSKAATYHFTGMATKKDGDAGFGYLMLAFDMGHYSACLLAAKTEMLSPKHSDTGFRYLMRGCDLGYYSACLLAAKAEMLTPKHSVRSERPDPAKAPPLLQKACLKGDVIEACENYADMHFRGFEDVVKRDPRVAFEYSERACHLGSLRSCYNLAQMYQSGTGTEKDENKSKHYMKVTERLRQMQDPSTAQEKV